MARALTWDFDAREADALDRFLRDLPTLIKQEMATDLGVLLDQAKSWMIVHRLTGGTTPTRLKIGTGNLIASWRTRVRFVGGELIAELRQDQRYRSAVYGPVHEYGATIRPRHAKYLAIPLNAEARSKRPRQFRDLFVVQSRRGNLLLMQSLGLTVWPMYLLVKQVVIPARRPLGATWDVYEPKVLPLAERTVDRLLASTGQLVAQRRQGYWTGGG